MTELAQRSNHDPSMTNGRVASPGPAANFPAVSAGQVTAITGHQNAGGFGQRLFHAVDVLQAHEGQGTVGGTVRHRQRSGTTGSDPPGRTGNGGGRRDHRQ
jgi:hypothetical protein